MLQFSKFGHVWFRTKIKSTPQKICEENFRFLVRKLYEEICFSFDFRSATFHRENPIESKILINADPFCAENEIFTYGWCGCMCDHFSRIGKKTKLTQPFRGEKFVYFQRSVEMTEWHNIHILSIWRENPITFLVLFDSIFGFRFRFCSICYL